MQETKQFQCPFEKKGREEGAIIEVALGEDREARLRSMVSAFMQLHSLQDKMAIRFTPPPSILTDCLDINTLKPRLITYQSEILAADIDYRVRPLIPYLMTAPWVKYFVDATAKSDTKRVVAATVLMAKIQELGVASPRNIVEQAAWIERTFRIGLAQGLSNPAEDMIFGEQGEERLKVITMEPSSLMFHLEREFITDRVRNKNCFGIVKTPFYPKTFGRYSEQVEIWVSREADFAGLSSGLRKKIRTQSNTILREHGVAIKSIEDDVQVLGLWIPENMK